MSYPKKRIVDDEVVEERMMKADRISKGTKAL